MICTAGRFSIAYKVARSQARKRASSGRRGGRGLAEPQRSPTRFSSKSPQGSNMGDKVDIAGWLLGLPNEEDN